MNYRASCYKKAHILIFERTKIYDEDQGRVRGETNIIEPLWTKGSILPYSVIDVVDTDNDNDEDTDDENLKSHLTTKQMVMRWKTSRSLLVF